MGPNRRIALALLLCAVAVAGACQADVPMPAGPPAEVGAEPPLEAGAQPIAETTATPTADAAAVPPDTSATEAPTSHEAPSPDPAPETTSPAGPEPEAPTLDPHLGRIVAPWEEPCPPGHRTQVAKLTEVDEWANLRAGPSLDAEIVGRLDRGAEVIAYPETLSTDATGRLWINVIGAEVPGCASIAAALLTDRVGRLDRPLVGLTYEIPAALEDWFPTMPPWTQAERGSLFATRSWSPNGTGISTLEVAVDEGRLIDEKVDQAVANQEQLEGRPPPTPLHEDVAIAGADRAVRIRFLSASGDMAWNQLHAEVGEYTITVAAGLYHEDFGNFRYDDLAAFVDSVRIERAVLLATLDAADTPADPPDYTGECNELADHVIAVDHVLRHWAPIDDAGAQLSENPSNAWPANRHVESVLSWVLRCRDAVEVVSSIADDLERLEVTAEEERLRLTWNDGIDWTVADPVVARDVDPDGTIRVSILED